MNAPYMIEFEHRLYPYENVTLMKIAIAENAFAGIVADGVWRLVPHEFGYAYEPADIDEIMKPVETPIEIETELVA